MRAEPREPKSSWARRLGDNFGFLRVLGRKSIPHFIYFLLAEAIDIFQKMYVCLWLTRTHFLFDSISLLVPNKLAELVRPVSRVLRIVSNFVILVVETHINYNMFNHDSQKAKMGLLDFLDYVPIAGHVKGVIHLVAGDEDKAEEAFIKANRTAIVGGAAALGGLAGPVGAAAAAAGAGAEYDLLLAAGSDGKHVNGVAKIIDTPDDPVSWVEGVGSVAGDVIGLFDKEILGKVLGVERNNSRTN